MEQNADRVFIEHQNRALIEHEQQIYGFFEYRTSRTSKILSEHEQGIKPTAVCVFTNENVLHQNSNQIF